MTLESRKQNIVESLQILREDCAWFNEQGHIDSAIALLTQVTLRSDIYPMDPVSQEWKRKNDIKLEAMRKQIMGE